VSKALKLLLIAAIFNGLSWIILIPIWQYPDEQSHFAQVQHAAELGFNSHPIPNTSYEVAISEKYLGTQRDEIGNNKFTYHPEFKLPYSSTKLGPHEEEINNLSKDKRKELVKYEATSNPPLYYFLSSIVYKLFSDGNLFTRVISVRILSLSFFVLSVFIAYKIGEVIFEKKKILPLVLASLVAFKPMLVFSSTGILPDPLTNLIFSATILLSLKIIQKGILIRYIAAGIILFFLGFITRQQAAILLPIIALSILLNLLKRKLFWKIFIFVISLTLLLLILFYSRFLHVLVPEISIPNPRLLLTVNFITNFKSTIRHSIAEVLPWYWGVYKWLSLTLPPITYQIINRILLIAGIGILIKTGSLILSRKIKDFDFYFIFLILISLVYFLAFSIGDYFFQTRYGYTFGIQGRYFFPLVVAHLSIVLIGLIQIIKPLFRNYSKLVLALIPLFIIIFNDYTLSFLASKYYDVSNLQIFLTQASQYKPPLFKGTTIIILLAAAFISQIIFLIYLTKALLNSDEKI